MAKCFFSNSAVADLTEIWEYTFEVWSENQADKYYELIIETCKELSKNPLVGKSYAEFTAGILGFGVGKHIIFYRQLNLKEIEIVRILHERMDIKARRDEF